MAGEYDEHLPYDEPNYYDGNMSFLPITLDRGSFAYTVRDRGAFRRTLTDDADFAFTVPDEGAAE